jgi:hypothetical protein
MGALTEAEIFSCLSENFVLAAQHCEDLARLPRKGPSYSALRNELRLIEGAARQASVWRQDTRWLQIGLYVAEAHKRAGDWLRGYRLPSGQRVAIREGQLHPLFVKLAENLRSGHRKAEEFRTKATNRVGMILPKPVVNAGPHRETTPVGYRKTVGGLLIPGSA